MRRTSSLVARVTVNSLAITLVMVLALLAALAWRLEYGASELDRRSLAAQAAEIARYLTREADAIRIDLPAGLANSYADPGRGYHFAVLDRQGRLLLGSPGIVEPLDMSLLLHGQESHKRNEDEREEDGEARYFARSRAVGVVSGGSFPISVAGRRLWVQVSQGGDHPDVILEGFILEFIEEAGWVLVPFLVVLILVNAITIRRSLSPLTEVSRQAAAIGPATMSPRLPDAGLPRELQPVVMAVNGALARLDEAFRLQRDFIADAAHEIRTPLAILEAHLDALPDRKVAAELRDDVHRLGRLIGQMLRAAELETLSIGSEERADLREVCRSVASAMAPLAVRQQRSIEFTGEADAVIVRGNREALADAVRNLVENGLRHTPEGTAVEIAVSAGPPAIRVRDSGTGIPEALQEKVLRRFWRDDRRREGSGLGLAIVARIVEAHGAVLRVGSAPQGGAEFSIEFAEEASPPG